MTDQNKTALRGIIPLPPRAVLSTPYIVQTGDTVESITGRFTSPYQWPGLVGANVHRKALADADGQKYAVFAELKVGEPLFIPASWADSTGNVGGCTTYGMDQFRSMRGMRGQVGLDPIKLGPSPEQGSSLAQQDPIVSFVAANWNTILQGIPGFPMWQVPVGPTGQPYTPQDIGRVLAGFLPYLAKMPGGLPPGVSLPVEPLPTAPPATWMPLLSVLAKSAADLLGASQVPSGNVLQRVPWDQIPWKSFPWQVFKSCPACWEFFQASTQVPAKATISPSPSPPLQAVSFNHTPNFTTENWQSAWPNIPWSEIDWGSLDPSILDHSGVKECLSKPGAAERIKQMSKFPTCFTGKGPEVFAAYLCPKADGSYQPLENCGDSLPPLPCPTGTHLDPVTKACIPDTPVQPPPTASCQPGWTAFPAPNLPQGIVCCPDGSVWDATTGMCLSAAGPVQPGNVVDEKAKSGLGTVEKVAIGVAAVGTLGLLYSLWSKK